ncbi:MAG TPA: Hsp20/alpha crystallin family protein [Phycisphaerae bacterium]|nr:Hsp20/alpha crystallin family protein [Phycisphaerae bacterium]HOI53774.1 Hsp20/alpha crystallin family protein [Phycisphaerae bacterium]
MDLVPWKRGRDDSALQSLRNEFNRIFDRFWSGELEPLHLGRWLPAVDVSETDNDVTVRAETPGIDPKDIEVYVEGDVLTIKGEKKEETETKDRNFHRVERQYGSFSRSIQLPANVEADKVEAQAANGVLTIRLPKQEDEKRKKVQIKAD